MHLFNDEKISHVEKELNLIYDIERDLLKLKYISMMIYIGRIRIRLRENGKIRQEGKNYIVQDGDIIFFKFNV